MYICEGWKVERLMVKKSHKYNVKKLFRLGIADTACALV